MRETADYAPDLLLSKVNSFADIFQKLSSNHASIKPYWSIRWCHAFASLLCICRNPSFGLATKAKGITRVRAKGKPGSKLRGSPGVKPRGSPGVKAKGSPGDALPSHGVKHT